MLLVTKIFNFEMAHYLPNHDKNCKYLHGHSYKLEITIAGRQDKKDPNSSSYQMLIDFGKLKEIVDRNIIDIFDHSLTVYKDQLDKELEITLKKHFSERLNIVNYRPTAESMCIDFYGRIKHDIDQFDNIHIKRIRLYETETSYADFEPDEIDAYLEKVKHYED